MNSFAVANSRIGTLPNELIEKIWIMNYDWGANIIQKYTKKYIKNKVNSIFEMIKFARLNCQFNSSLRGYNIFYKNKILDQSSVLKTLNACKCCQRHQINKPKNLSYVGDQYWGEYNWYKTNNCKCNCRHLSRFICRNIESY